VPLFNLTTLLNSRSKKETIPFLSYFMPGKVDDVEQSIDGLLAADVEALKELNQEIYPMKLKY
jgi:hypothetical protein